MVEPSGTRRRNDDHDLALARVGPLGRFILRSGVAEVGAVNLTLAVELGFALLGLDCLADFVGKHESRLVPGN
jgi:hypothetical protein